MYFFIPYIECLFSLEFERAVVRVLVRARVWVVVCFVPAKPLLDGFALVVHTHSRDN